MSKVNIYLLGTCSIKNDIVQCFKDLGYPVDLTPEEISSDDTCIIMFEDSVKTSGAEWYVYLKKLFKRRKCCKIVALAINCLTEDTFFILPGEIDRWIHVQYLYGLTVNTIKEFEYLVFDLRS